MTAILVGGTMRASWAQQGWQLPVIPTGLLQRGCDDCAGGGCTDHPLVAACPSDCSCVACRRSFFWADFEYLMWWGKGRRVPALVTTNTLGNSGVLGNPGTQVLFGDGDVGNKMAGGGRVTFGTWLDDYETLGVGARFFGVEGDETAFGATSGGTPVLSRPFFNVQAPAAQDALDIAFPAFNAGTINARTSSDILGTEAFLRTNVWAGQGYSVDLIGGYHFTRLDDDVVINSNSRFLQAVGPIAQDTVVDVTDIFDARNEFHGAELGLIADFHRGCWTMNALGKLSVGNMHQTVIIDGVTVVTPPAGPPATTAAGLLAQPSNIGAYSRDRTALVPEFGLNLVYHVESYLDLTLGYSVIYWSDVILAGDQIDVGVDQTQGIPRPAFAFRETDYWIHGLNLGVKLHY